MTEIKQEVRRLGSQCPDRSPMYPGLWLFTWARAPGMPWVLLAIEAHATDAAG